MSMAHERRVDVDTDQKRVDDYRHATASEATLEEKQHHNNAHSHPISSSEHPNVDPSGTGSDTSSVHNLDNTRYGLWSSSISATRLEYFTIISRALLLAILVMWAFLTLYWGSLAYSAQHTRNLGAWFINRDNFTIGNVILSAIQQSQSSPQPGIFPLGWQFLDPSDTRVVNDDTVINSVLDEQTWVAVVVSPNATSSLLSSLSSPSLSASYVPSSSITVYYAQARNEQAAGTYIVPTLTSLLGSGTMQAGNQIISTYLGSGLNQTELQALTNINVSKIVSFPVGWNIVNLRPYSAPVAAAVTLVGQIYTAILAFIITMANFNARQRISRLLCLRSYILTRVIVPMMVYIPLSLSYATISLPFKLPFGAKYTYAQGFFLFWAIAYLTMCALGLATEAVITILGVRFIAFFLLALIISNVSVAAVPIELQPRIYRYGRGFPVFNASQAIRTIIFNTKSHLGTNIGVLVGWVLLSVCTISLFTCLMARRERRSARESPVGLA